MINSQIFRVLVPLGCEMANAFQFPPFLGWMVLLEKTVLDVSLPPGQSESDKAFVGKAR